MSFYSNDEIFEQSTWLSSRITSDSESHVRRDGLIDDEKDLVHLHSKKAAAVFPELETEGADIEKQLSCPEDLFANTISICASSDCKSPLLPRTHGPQELLELDCWPPSIKEQPLSVILSSGSTQVSLKRSERISIFDGSPICPIEEASLVLDTALEDTYQENLQEKEVVIWLHDSVEDEETDYSFRSSECSNSSYETSLCEDSSVCESSSISLHTPDELSSYARDFERRFSLLDLEAEDSDWVNKEHVFDAFVSEFPSPSFDVRHSFQTEFLNSGFKSSAGHTAETKSTSNGPDYEEPIFWPFDQNLYWRSGFEKFLCMSPRKEESAAEPPGISRSRSIRIKLHEKSNHLLGRKDMQGGCRRKIVFSSSPTSAAAESKIKGFHDISTTRPVPSRLSRSSQALGEDHSFGISSKKRPSKLNLNQQKHHGDVL